MLVTNKRKTIEIDAINQNDKYKLKLENVIHRRTVSIFLISSVRLVYKPIEILFEALSSNDLKFTVTLSYYCSLTSALLCRFVESLTYVAYFSYTFHFRSHFSRLCSFHGLLHKLLMFSVQLNTGLRK